MRSGACRLLTVTVVLAACGGASSPTADTSADPALAGTEPAATEPPVTAPPATDPPITELPTTVPGTTAPAVTDPPVTDPPVTGPPTETPAPDRISAAGGVVQMVPAAGWDVVDVLDAIETEYEEGLGVAWTASPEQLELLIELDRGDAALGILRETRYALAPDGATWGRELLRLLGVQPNIEVTTTISGERGNSVRGTLPNGEFLRLDHVEVGGQLIVAIATSAQQPSAELNAEIDAMVASITVDPTAIPRLAHSVDVRLTSTAEDTGSTPFRIGVLVPPSWVQNPDATAVFEDPTGDAFVEFANYVADAAFDVLVRNELDDFGSEWLAQEPVREERLVDDVPFLVLWEGDPAVADAAIAMGSDGVIFTTAYLYAPGDPALLAAMVDSIEVAFSAANPDG